MAQLRFPEMTPGFVRLELTYEGEMGWTVHVWEAQDRRYLTAADRSEYSFLSGPEAADVVAAVLDGTLAG